MPRHECSKRPYADQDTAIRYALRHASRYGAAFRAYPCHLDRRVWHLTTKPLRTFQPTTQEETQP